MNCNTTHYRANSSSVPGDPTTPLQRAALSGVEARIASGERVGIVGQTGSGKSTLMQHLAGLLTPTSGQVLLDGVAAHSRTAAARDRRRRVGIAFQYPEEQVFEQTVSREVAFGPRNLGVKDAEIGARVRWALEQVGLEPDAVIHRSPFTLSGGELRRVALASVLVMQPDLLILDEPTAGLDPRGRRELLEHVERWQEDADQTLVMVSHDLASLAELVDRVIVLYRGRIVADGPSDRVLTDTEALRDAGLIPPRPVLLLRELKKAGWEIDTRKLTPIEAANEIAKAERRREPRAALPKEAE